MVVSTSSSRRSSSSHTGGLPPVTWDPPATFTLEKGDGGGHILLENSLQLKHHVISSFLFFISFILG